jgi:hypothetical protein
MGDKKPPRKPHGLRGDYFCVGFSQEERSVLG